MDPDTALPRPRFEAPAVPPGVRLVDPIDGGQFTFLTPKPVDPIRRDTDTLPIPVDGVAEIAVDRLQTPYLVGVWIRDENFDLVDQCTGGDVTTVESGRHVLEFSSVQLKVYLGIEGPFEVDARGEAVTVSTTEATELLVGVRSYHEQPARTITTTDGIRDVMRAISQFRSGLKTTSPERSFPTLRGHPPLLEFGDELSIPGGEALPEPSLSIEVPPRWDRVLPVAPLAYYLDAAVVPGSEPRLSLDGHSVPLVGEEDFHERVNRILKHVFTLDCVTRTEGLYDVDLHERAVIEDRIDPDFVDLYDSPLAERVRKYLEIPFGVVEPAMPEWKLTADVEPESDNARVLPFLAADLAEIRCPGGSTIGSRVLEDPSPDVETFFRDEPVLFRGSTDVVRSGNATQQSSIADRVFRPESTDSLMHTFVGDGIPMGATKMTAEAFRRRLEYEPAEPGRIRVDVVNNEDAMSDESVVSDVYGAREWIDFDVTIHEELDRAELRSVLGEETDFFHYIGHVEDEGIRCTDGHLDARSLSNVGVGAFLLNACQSYEQGRALVNAGALGGIVTLANIPNPTATSIGKTLARLLNTGFSIATARSLLEEDEQLASRYMVVGDGHANIVESQSGAPFVVKIADHQPDSVTIDIRGYPVSGLSLGGFRSWHVDAISNDSLNTARLTNLTVKNDVLQALCVSDDFPVLHDGQLLWSNAVSIDTFRDRP